MRFAEVRDWDDLEKIWRHVYRELDVMAPEDHAVLAVEGGFQEDRQCQLGDKFAEMMFERFGVPALAKAHSAPLSLYATGRTTGVLVDSGNFTTHVTTFYDGKRCASVPHGAMGGADSTEHLARSLRDRDCGYEACTLADYEVVRDIKEKLCFVGAGFDAYLAACEKAGDVSGDWPLEQEYELPDGQLLSLRTEERIRSPEMMFSPWQMGADGRGLHRAIYRSILQCESSMRPGLFHNIVLVGGNTKFSGFADRLTKELEKCLEWPESITVVAQPDRQFAAWIGGSLVAKLSTFRERCITKAEYEEFGARILRRNNEGWWW